MSSQGMAGDKHSADGFPIPMRGNETECGYDHDSRTLEFPIPIRVMSTSIGGRGPSMPFVPDPHEG